MCSLGKLHETKAAEHLKSLGWQLIEQDIQVGGVQIDILARDLKKCLHIVEVKSAGALSRGLIGVPQKLRLQRAASILAQQEPVELSIVVVDSLNIWLFESIDL